jgi:5-formyltetrahydrofolate cyclo-ligase
MTKAELRKVYQEKRLALQRNEIDSLSRNILHVLLNNIAFDTLNTIHVFLPILRKHEFNTWLLIDALKQKYPHLTLVLPKMLDDGSLLHIKFSGKDQLEQNQWGIEEPREGTHIAVENLDMVLVPLLCFDAQGNRVGYGKGFYDRFLNNCRPDCISVGVSFFDSVSKIEDVDAWDVPLQMAATPTNFYRFK